jgi:RES domain-containing protein
MARYFTVRQHLTRVLDLTNRRALRKAGVGWDLLTQARSALTQEIGLRAWEGGLEGVIVPSAADPAEPNLALFLDNQRPSWAVELTGVQTP